MEKKTIAEYFKGNVTPSQVMSYINGNGATILRTVKGDYLCENSTCEQDVNTSMIKINSCIEINSLMKLDRVTINAMQLISIEEVIR
jgi:Na+(H+)/acetate symporter ActP